MASAIKENMLSLILVVSSILLVSSAQSPGTTDDGECKLQNFVPNVYEMMKAKENIISSDNKSLANLVGYVYFYDKGFMPVVLTKLDIDDDKAALTTECSTLIWEFRYDSFSHSLNGDKLSLYLPDEYISGTQDNSRKHTCIVDLNSITLNSNYRFSCTDRVHSVCRADEDEEGYAKPVAELVLESFEFEYDGDVSLIKQRQFSKPVSSGCDNFS